MIKKKENSVYIVATLSLPSIPRSILLYAFRTLLNKSVCIILTLAKSIYLCFFVFELTLGSEHSKAKLCPMYLVFSQISPL